MNSQLKFNLIFRGKYDFKSTMNNYYSILLVKLKEMTNFNIVISLTLIIIILIKSK